MIEKKNIMSKILVYISYYANVIFSDNIISFTLSGKTFELS